MVDYTHHNTLRFGYDGGQFNTKSEGSVLSYEMDRCTREPMSFPEECKFVAQMMADKAKLLGRKLYVFLSGGMDSEVMVKAFIAAKLDFEIITFKFARGWNQHELDYVEKFCARHNLTPNYFELDAQTWLQSPEAKSMYFENFCMSPIMLPHMKLMSHVWDNLNGMPVIGGGDIVVHNHKADGWYYCKFEVMLPWYWYAKHHNIDCGVAFFQHIPEITLAMLREPKIQRIASGSDSVANRMLADVRLTKYAVYKKYWPDLENRFKFGGGEMIAHLLHRLEAEWSRERPFGYADIWGVPYADFVSSIEPVQSSERLS